ncbi:alpha/beta fold hydrolase [Cereibacter azotoformans]|uniref:Pimeloyl-ACP methyl ester carboxylesterase n=1 Tax=Cereibacter azotoformans TaxID=43057 RepID=A0A2T5K8A5_9RHOB|nr:alpha/beta fold hydrolase [Cereibacter azotoformans]AXQ94920.1 alpha/beta fold hydrolase [Cereibacter sphaeroides]MBO4170208.1 alpha/beta fold hydrolase [Cereibacter azotoformans]PTR18665.1 pimeloyl-ACP methyl ester carboxylesterase [Cereibacter azotoformans]UIJ30498.1 alpha/beta fold hydrolase [Cereibacter azotoformans]
MSRIRHIRLIFVFNLMIAVMLGTGLALWTPDLPRAELEQRYLANPADLVEVAGTTLHMRDRGRRDAPAVILIHGFGSSLHTWSAWQDRMAGSRRVISFDLPGFGLSPPDATGNYSDARVSQIVLGIMDRLDLKQADLIGNSIGGRIAFTFAAAHPERVRKLVLVSPDGYESPGFTYGQPPDVPMLAQAVRFWLPKPLLRLSLGMAYADPTVMSDQIVSRYHDLIRAPGVREALFDRMRQTVLVPPETLLANVRAPTLLLWGEEDAVIPAANAGSYARALRDAQTVLLPRMGHVPQEEGPARSLAPVEAFLAT